MTDNEIIKALECCTSSTTNEACNGCPLYSTSICMEMENGLEVLALDLINRQKAEIERLIDAVEKTDAAYFAKDAAVERLRDEVKEKTETIVSLKDQATGWSIDFCNLKAKLNTAKAEAIKEFSGRLKVESFLPLGSWISDRIVTEKIIDNLAEEMVGDE